MSDEELKPSSQVGYRTPPVSSRLQKGQSGNPKGRPRGSRKTAPHEALLGRPITIHENGIARRIPADEAFLLHLVKQGLQGNSTAARKALKTIEKAENLRTSLMNQQTLAVDLVFVKPGSVSCALEPLRIAKKLDRYRDTGRIALEPWVVEAALERFGDRRLSLEEQKTVYKATRAPHKVKWPGWWKVRS